MERQTTLTDLLTKVREIGPGIREYSHTTEAERRLSGPAYRAMRDAGLYRMWRPREYGGLEVDPKTGFRVSEEVARFDSAAGWNLQLSIAVDTFLAWIPNAGVEEILRDERVTLAGAFNPPGQAIAEDGGYRVTGRWPFLSGVHQAAACLVTAIAIENGQPVTNEQGMPVQLLTLIPQNEGSIPDSWHTLGMRGTGSHDFEVNGTLVPKQRTAPMMPLQHLEKPYDGALYRHSIWPAIAILATPALGAARSAIDELKELADQKTPSYSANPLKERHVAQAQLAQAEATLGAGRAYLYEVLDETWDWVNAGNTITMEQKLKMQLAATHAVQSSVQAVNLVRGAAGSSAMRAENPFERHFRDVNTISQHGFISASRYESVGKIMLGLESDWPWFPF